MDDTPPPLSARRTGGVRSRTLVLIRWVAVIGQAVTLLIVHFGFGFAVPIVPALVVTSCSAVMNVIVVLRHGHRALLSERDAVLYLAFDIIQLSVLLFFTGGLRNPFELLLLAPVTVSASVLSMRSTVALSVLAIACLSPLAFWYQPLPWQGDSPNLPSLYLLAEWAAMVCAVGFTATYVAQVARQARRMSDALTAAQIALAREQRLAALGTLAAAAAHELGSPLATIAVVAREVTRDLPRDSPLLEDMELLIAQTARCRDILAELARRPETEGGDAFLRLPLADLVNEAAGPHRSPRVSLEIVAGQTTGPEPHLARSPEIVHGLGNLLANAIQFATSRVDVLLAWDEAEVSVCIGDDGPGFPQHLLGRLGEPYLSGRAEESGHMGLGIFIAQNLLLRTGATVTFAEKRVRGAEVVVRWPRAILEGAKDRQAEREFQWTRNSLA